MPTNAEQRRATPTDAGPLEMAIREALPALMRARVLDAVATAQAAAGGPVTSQQARTALRDPVLRHARAFSGVAARVTRLGPDDLGRVLRAAGRDRKGFALWWVEGIEVPNGDPA